MMVETEGVIFVQATQQKKSCQKIVVRCDSQSFQQWAAALSFYNVSLSSLEHTLEHDLAHAAQDCAALFVIVDNRHIADEITIASLRAYMEENQQATSAMRIVFVADKQREIPSPLFRVLANYDIYDIIVPPKENALSFNPYVEVARVLSQPKTYSDIVAYIAGAIVNPKLVGLSLAQELKEKTRAQTRIAIAQIDQRRGGSTHTALLLARTLVLLGYKVAFFVEPRTWKNIRRCYPRARCSVENGLITLSGIDFYRNEGFAGANGYDYVVADFGCARWIDLHPNNHALMLSDNFSTASLSILTSVVSPWADHASFERVLKIWQKKGELQKLGGVKFAFFGMPYDAVFENWQEAAQRLNSKAELYRIPYLPDPLHYEPKGDHCPELISLLSPVLHAKSR